MLYRLRRILPLVLILASLAGAGQAVAAEPPTLDKGDTAWVLISSALVLMMIIPGLALFYGGLVKKNNVLATLMQSFTVCSIVAVLWPALGYTLAFSEGSEYIGSFSKMFLGGVGLNSLNGSIPESVFVMFQFTFAAITIALIFGSITDRIKFSALLLFTPLWLILVYCPIAHWVWGPGGFIGGTGVADFKGVLGYGAALDYAGGTVVHINSGVAALVLALVLGRRRDYGKTQYIPHNLVLSVMGAALLWVGWFGFNAGSALGANERAGMAMLVTNTAAAIAALTWIIIELIHRGKASVLGGISGAVAGLVAITPASGFVDFKGSLVIGIAGAVACYWAVSYLKSRLKYDDSLDVFGIHGIGGIVGAILTGVLALKDIGGASGLLEDNSAQLMAQIISVAVTAAYSAIATYIIAKVVDLSIGLRVDEEAEKTGLDLAMHGERVV